MFLLNIFKDLNSEFTERAIKTMPPNITAYGEILVTRSLVDEVFFGFVNFLCLGLILRLRKNWKVELF